MIEIDEVQPAEAHMGEEDIVDDEPDARFRAVIVGVAAHAPDIEAGRTCILLKRGEVRYFSSIVADAEQPLIGHSVAGNCRYGQRHIPTTRSEERRGVQECVSTCR